MKKIKRPLVEVASGAQVNLFAPVRSEQAVRANACVQFRDPDPKTIYLGDQSIESHLRNAGLLAPGVVRETLAELDWSAFEAHYKAGGRPPYHPRLMMGIVLYGVSKGVNSLRGLEQLARADLGCMWISGGIFPDHSILGRFINRHAEQITGDFFQSLTREVLKRTNSNCDSVAGDGTVVQAAASRYGLLKKEAALQAQEKAQRASEEDPEDIEKTRKKDQADEVVATLEVRREARRKKGKPAEYIKVSPTEPEAMVQPLKTKRMAPSYKASVLANDKRVVVAVEVDPSSETKVVRPMLEKVKQLSGQMPKQGMYDAGYHCADVIDVHLENDMDLLCPAGHTQADGSAKKKSPKYFPKRSFVYDEESDSYLCPGGHRLDVREPPQGAGAERYVRYSTKACSGCSVRDKCTRSKTGRKVKRYAIDEKKEALCQVMSQKRAQLRYIKRQAMVEPVFGDMRYIQGLTRFRRRGLFGVRLEFFVHAAAHNLRRVVAVCFFLILSWRWGHHRRTNGTSPSLASA